MKFDTTVAWEFRRWFFCSCLFMVGLLGLTGCAANHGADSGAAEIVTDSDEPESRKRARIRLELAMGYFEQGQTTTALDELKQAIATDPTYGDAYSLRGLIYMRLNEFRVADESFRKALALSPKDSNIMHNLGWLLCQQAKYSEAQQLFTQALSNIHYVERAKTFRALGLCQLKAEQRAEAEQSLLKSYEFDAGNPITAYNLANLLFLRGDFVRAQFYVRRLNNSELANAESLWLGVKVERRLDNKEAMQQLATQLVKRYPKSMETSAYQRGAFDD